MIDSLFRFLLFYIYQINIFHKENVHEIHLKVIEREQHEKYGNIQHILTCPFQEYNFLVFICLILKWITTFLSDHS